MVRDERRGPSIIFAEVMDGTDMEKLRGILTGITERFNMQGPVDRDEFLQAIIETMVAEEEPIEQ